MARIKGVDLPKDKIISVALTYIYGIGDSLSKTILEAAKVDPTKKADDLSADEIKQISKEVSKHAVEGDLRKEVSMNIKRLMEIGSYRGLRHRKGLPVRGQRTNRNTRTWKNKRGTKKIVANKKKVN